MPMAFSHTSGAPSEPSPTRACITVRYVAPALPSFTPPSPRPITDPPTLFLFFFFLNNTAPPDTSPLPLPAPLPIWGAAGPALRSAYRACEHRREAGAAGRRPPAPRRGRDDRPRPRKPASGRAAGVRARRVQGARSEEHTSELQSRLHLVCRPLLEKK